MKNLNMIIYNSITIGKCRCKKGHLISPNLDTKILEIDRRDKAAKISIGDRKYI